MIDLGESEYSLMSLLFNNAPHPVPRLSAQKALWHAFGDKENALSRCVTSLRRKMDSSIPGSARGFMRSEALDIELICKPVDKLCGI